ncbi:ComEC family competence protein, partial [Bacteroidales bacterium OttesenSCG-928-J19]|nr:ComEC family competence protein [Bacteroidales bacterium OttesenSCG-928-J19]
MEPYFLRQAPFLRLSICLIAGIVAQYHCDLSALYPGLALFSLLLIGLPFVRKIDKQIRWRWLSGAGYTGLFFVVGGFLTGQAWEDSNWEVEPGFRNYLVRVLDDPIEKPKTCLYKVRILAADTEIQDQVAGKQVLIYLPKEDRNDYPLAGDCFLAQVSLDIPRNYEGAEFDYPLYLRKQSIAAVGFVRRGNWQTIALSPPWYETITYKALQVRRESLNRLKQLLPENNRYALSAALFFGYQSDMDRDLRQQFANTGAGHILSVSGVHFNILFGIVFFLLSPLGMTLKGRVIRLLITLPLIWGFAFITGFSAPVNRAAWMATIGIVGSALLRESFTINTVAIAAFFMLLDNPLYLFDVSFQFSFSAVVAIVLLNPYLSKLLSLKNRILVYFWNLSCVSLTAQVGVLPISIYYFHTLPFLFLVTNILI